jgi:hypothetical protein
MEEKPSYSIMDIKEADPQLEKHGKEVIEKYLEYELTVIQRYIDEGKNLPDLLESVKNTLWFIKNERVEQMDKELGI